MGGCVCVGGGGCMFVCVFKTHIITINKKISPYSKVLQKKLKT